MRNKDEILSIRLFFEELFVDDYLYKEIDRSDWLDELFSDSYDFFHKVDISGEKLYSNLEVAEMLEVKGGAQRIINLMNGASANLKPYIQPTSIKNSYRHSALGVFKFHMIHFLLMKGTRISAIEALLKLIHGQAVVFETSGQQSSYKKGNQGQFVTEDRIQELMAIQSQSVRQAILKMHDIMEKQKNRLSNQLFQLKENSIAVEITSIQTEVDYIVDRGLKLNEQIIENENMIIDLKKHLLQLESLKKTADDLDSLTNEADVVNTPEAKATKKVNWFLKLFTQEGEDRSSIPKQPNKSDTANIATNLVNDLVTTMDVTNEIIAVKDKISEKKNHVAKLKEEVKNNTTIRNDKMASLQTLKNADWRIELKKESADHDLDISHELDHIGLNEADTAAMPHADSVEKVNVTRNYNNITAEKN